LSDVKPLNFRRVEDGPASNGMAKPHWLAPRETAIRRAFVEEPRGPIILPAPSEPPPEGEAEEQEPSPFPGQNFAPPGYAPPVFPQPQPFSPEPPRRSSLPPRKSVYPPQVTISRYPAPPIEAEIVPSPEQEAFVTAALELASLRARVLSTVESDLLALAVHIAQAIIEREVKVDPSLHTTLARTAVLALGDTQSARLRVSRTAYRAITELHGEAAIDVDGVRVEVSMDASFNGLSVVAEAGPSRVDARVAERLASVLRAMEAEHRRNNAEIAAIDEHEP
jgi:hypothetical protein